jgi:CBS domain-containing protein
LVGLLSERDLIDAAANRIFGFNQKSKSALLKTELVKSIMKKRLVTVTPDTPIKEAAHLMAEKRSVACPSSVRERHRAHS